LSISEASDFTLEGGHFTMKRIAVSAVVSMLAVSAGAAEPIPYEAGAPGMTELTDADLAKVIAGARVPDGRLSVFAATFTPPQNPPTPPGVPVPYPNTGLGR
jgi:hypothetical protein